MIYGFDFTAKVNSTDAEKVFRDFILDFVEERRLFYRGEFFPERRLFNGIVFVSPDIFDAEVAAENLYRWFVKKMYDFDLNYNIRGVGE